MTTQHLRARVHMDRLGRTTITRETDMNMPEKKPDLARLCSALAWAKTKENTAREERVNIENEILAHPDVAAALKDEGTVTVEGVKVTTGYTRAWDGAALGALAPQVDPIYWPFDVEFKEVRRKSREIEEKAPDLWALIRQALTVKPRKPSIALVVEGDA